MTQNETNLKTEEKKKILQPKNDVVFQALFTRGKESITKALIEDILNIKINKIELDKSKDLLNENIKEKNGRLDLRAIINDNVECDIEIQLTSHESHKVANTRRRIFRENLDSIFTNRYNRTIESSKRIWEEQ